MSDCCLVAVAAGRLGLKTVSTRPALLEPVLNQPSRVLFVAAFDEDGVVVAGPDRRRLDDHADESVAVSSQESSAVFVRFFFFFFFFFENPHANVRGGVHGIAGGDIPRAIAGTGATLSA